MSRNVGLKRGLNRIEPRNARRGTDVALPEAIIQAAEAVGNPSKQGEGGLIGYLEWFATEEPRAFGALLGRVLALQKTVGPEIEAEVSTESETFMAELADMGDRMSEDHIPETPIQGFALGLRMYRRAHPEGWLQRFAKRH
jgi:hypothetical protein